MSSVRVAGKLARPSVFSISGHTFHTNAGERPAASSPPIKARMLKVRKRKRIFETLNTVLQLNVAEAKCYVQADAGLDLQCFPDRQMHLSLAMRYITLPAKEHILWWRWTLLALETNAFDAGDKITNRCSHFSHIHTASYQQLPSRAYSRDDFHSSPILNAITLWRCNGI